MPKAQTRANRKYNEKAYDRIYLTVAKGDKEKIEDFAKEEGLSLNSFIKAAIHEKMNKKDAEA